MSVPSAQEQKGLCTSDIRPPSLEKPREVGVMRGIPSARDKHIQSLDGEITYALSVGRRIRDCHVGCMASKPLSVGADKVVRHMLAGVSRKGRRSRMVTGDLR